MQVIDLGPGFYVIELVLELAVVFPCSYQGRVVPPFMMELIVEKFLEEIRVIDFVSDYMNEGEGEVLVMISYKCGRWLNGECEEQRICHIVCFEISQIET